MMKQFLLSIIALIGISMATHAADLSSLSWGEVCSGKMGAEWYGTAEAQALADIVLDVQKNNGGWMKNDQLNKLTASQLATLTSSSSRASHSCFDNVATTMEMRFLAKVYQGCKVEKYRTAFIKALNLIFTAEKGCGGWSQYYPFSGGGSYRDYITFNDDLTVNVMKILRDIHANTGDFKDLVDEATRERCLKSFNKGIETILKCQIDDNGVKAAWCAQHDTIDFLPTEGRPHEHPSVSGSESVSLLSFLMTIKDPSPELQDAITAAVTWLDNHKIPGKAIQDYTNENGQSDRRIVDNANSAIWGRFIQLGGESGKKVYDKFLAKLKSYNRTRSKTYNGTTYSYKEHEILSASYREDMAYQPVFGIYDDTNQHLYYRHLYNYADSDPVVDSKGLPIATSLRYDNRRNYQYLGSWCQNVINVEYPAWKQKIDAGNEAGDATLHELSTTTYESSENTTTYKFTDGFTVSNSGGKGYAAGKNNTVKYSAGVEYTINIPQGLSVVKIMFNGYDNTNVDAYLSKLNGVTYKSTDYPFPNNANGNAFVNHVIDFPTPVSGTLPFTIGSKQCCLIITLYCVTPTGMEEIIVANSNAPVKKIQNGQVIIVKDNKTYNLSGQRMD